jgi:DNA polymerase III epsilon subunit-like protein
MYLFFDTETNGLPKNMKAPMTEIDNWPRVIQLAWSLRDVDGKVIAERCNLIIPDGWEIPKEKFWIDNGYATETNQFHGYHMAAELRIFAEALNRCELLIAHNMDFDHPVLGAEMIRYGVRAERRVDKFCTMKSTTTLVGAKNSRGGVKWPNLTDLHTFCFGQGFD